jgi:branched-subunit amino acid transport protein AzlD
MKKSFSKIMSFSLLAVLLFTSCEKNTTSSKPSAQVKHSIAKWYNVVKIERKKNNAILTLDNGTSVYARIPKGVPPILAGEFVVPNTGHFEAILKGEPKKGDTLDVWIGPAMGTASEGTNYSVIITE